MGEHVACYKAYDIRGRVPDELDEDIAKKTALAYCEQFAPRKVVVGRDMRLSSESIAGAVIEGFTEAGVDVVDIGLGGTEMVYFGAFHLEDEGVDGGIVITASHNPADYNGMKIVQKGARPVSGDTGLKEMEKRVAEGGFAPSGKAKGKVEPLDLMPAYVEHLLSYVDKDKLKPLKIVTNPGNGCAGLVVDALAPHLPFELIEVHHEPDGTFPNGVPNPMLEENRIPTAEAVVKNGADLGVAWDGDYDRCFFFDEKGEFIEGYYVVGLFAAEMLKEQPGAAVVHDPRLVWNTEELVEKAGGQPVMSKTGHAFIKERMRKEDAVYGGEISAHHYFKRFAYCDSGMIPWMVMAGLLSKVDKPASQLLAERATKYPITGEINRRIDDATAAIARVREVFEPQADAVDMTDGLSLAFADWRLNIRMSNTEPILRLNLESRGDRALLEQKRDEVLALVEQG